MSTDALSVAAAREWRAAIAARHGDLWRLDALITPSRQIGDDFFPGRQIDRGRGKRRGTLSIQALRPAYEW